MSFSYLQPDNLHKKFTESKTFMTPLFSPLPEYERIARNRPYPNINKNYPRNTDGTLAAIIQDQPKRIIQQVPTGTVKAGDPVKDIIASYVLTEVIIPNANTQADVLQKSWGITQKALTFGSSPSMTFFNNSGEYSGADFRLIYIKDLFLEPGKLTFADCNYIFVRAWYQESDIDAIIAREGKLEDGDVKSGWDITNLKEIKDKKSEKDAQATSSGEKERNVHADGIEIIHCFQKGVKAKFYSISTQTQKVVRTIENTDPRGCIPIQDLYANIDFENPLGRGAVELSGGMQNFIDSTLQSYQYMQGLMMNPPLKKRGNVVMSTLKYKPNAVWDMGSSENNDVTPMEISTTAIDNFSNIYGLAKSQILALNNNGDTSTSAEIGNPGFSKTSQGVQAQQLKLGISDNYMRKQFESWFEQTSESLLNLHFANKHGKDTLQLDEDTANRLKQLKDFKPSLITNDNVFTIDYDDYKDAITFTVDASTSELKDSEAERDRLSTLLELAMKYPQLSSKQGGPVDTDVLARRIVQKTGVEDPEEIAGKLDENDPNSKQAMQAQMQQQIQQVQEQAQKAIEEAKKSPSEALKFEDLPVNGKIQMAAQAGIQLTPQDFEAQMHIDNAQAALQQAHQTQVQSELTPPPTPPDPEAEQYLQGLEEQGVPPEVLKSAKTMLDQGVTPEEVNQIVIQVLQGGQSPQEEAQEPMQNEQVEMQGGMA